MDIKFIPMILIMAVSTSVVSTLAACFLKLATQAVGKPSFSLNDITAFILSLSLRLEIWAAIVCYIIALGMTVFSLSLTNFGSYLSVFTAINISMFFIAGVLFFDESLTIVRLTGLSLLLIGVFLIIQNETSY